MTNVVRVILRDNRSILFGRLPNRPISRLFPSLRRRIRLLERELEEARDELSNSLLEYAKTLREKEERGY